MADLFCEGHLRFRAPLGELRATYTVHLTLIGKLVVDFVFMLTALFSRSDTGERLRAKINWKSAFLNQVQQFWINFHVVGDVSQEPRTTVLRCNAFTAICVGFMYNKCK